MRRKLIILLLLGLIVPFHTGCTSKEEASVRMAVEFNDHAACAHIAQSKGWFEAIGLNIDTFNNYTTGTALASALSRGDVNVAYICLIPAINARANGKVPIKVVAGTHKYGYGVLVDPDKVKTVKDFEKPQIRIGCPNEGSVLDVLLYKMIQNYQLDEDEIMNKVRRMSPAKILMALKTGQLDVGFLPEQFTSMGEELGFRELLSAHDLWPEMQGSVLVIHEDLIRDHPDIVQKLVDVTRQGTRYINEQPEHAAKIMVNKLAITEDENIPLDVENTTIGLDISRSALLKSITGKMEYSIDIDPEMVQAEINYLAELGYIKKFDAKDILDMRFLQDE